MMDSEVNIPDDLPGRLDSAVEALWRGDGTQLERLLGNDAEPGPLIGDLLAPALSPAPQRGIVLPEDVAVSGYTILREIGRGGMGVVYEAEQHEPRRRVALKVLHGPGGDERRDRLFQKEIHLLARLRHPGIATIYSSGQTGDGRQFFTMELVTGELLNVYVAGKNPSLRDRLELFARICEAVAHAHEHGVIHRDLKPSNILVDADGHPHIVDFGLARATDPRAGLTVTVTHTGILLGTLPYMSPEQARGEHDAVDERSDVYALGVILYELLTGYAPYKLGANLIQAIKAICDEPPRPLRQFARDLPGDVQAVALKALEKDVTRRYASVRALWQDVQRYLRGEPVLASQPGSLRILVRRVSRHRTTWAPIAAAVLLVALSWAGGQWWRGQRQRQAEHQSLAAARRAAIFLQAGVEEDRAADVLGHAEALLQRAALLPEATLVRCQVDFNRPQGVGRVRARGTLLDILRRDPTRWECAALLAEFCRHTGQPEEAARWETQAAQHRPDTAWYLRSFTTLALEQAAAYAREAVRRDRDFAAAWERLLRLALLLKNHAEALEAADRLIASEPQEEKWQLARCHALLGLDRTAEALRQYDKLVLMPNSRCRAYTERAHLQRRLGHYEQAVADYTLALELAEKDGETPAAWIRYYRAIPLWIMGRLEEASADLQAGRITLGRVSYADARLYILLMDAGRPGEAVAALQAARYELAQSDGSLGRILACLAGEIAPQELIAAACAADDAEQICEAYYYAGETLRLDGNLTEAISCFEACLQTGVRYDPQEFPVPMNEYDLAAWRLRTLVGGDMPSEN